MTTWVQLDKSATTFTPVEKTDNSVPEQYLAIEDIYSLLIGDSFSLLIQEGVDGIEWTPVAKS